MRKKLEPLPGMEHEGNSITSGVVPDGESIPSLPRAEERTAPSTARDRRLALRKRKLAEDAVLISEELRSSTELASRSLVEVSERVIMMEHDTVVSSEAASAILDTAVDGRNVAESFRNKAGSTGQVLTTLSMITHGILADVQGFKQLGDRLTGVTERAVRYMSHLGAKGEQIAIEAANAHEYADEINVLSFNMHLETSRIGDEAAAITVVAKRFLSITRQAEDAVTQIQQHQSDFDATIEQLDGAVAALQRKAQQQSSSSSQLVGEIGQSIEKMRTLQAMSANVQKLSGEVDELLAAYSKNAAKIRQGLEEMASSIAEISAGIHEQTASMTEIARRAAKLDELSTEFKQHGSVDSIEAINAHMMESNKGIQQIRITIHQIVDSIHQIAASSTQQQTLSHTCSEQLKKISTLGDATNDALVETFAAVETLTAGLVAGRRTIGEVLSTIAGYNEEGNTILNHLDNLLDELEGIEQSLGRLLDYSMMISTTGFSGEIEAARLGGSGEMLSSISGDVSQLGDLSASVARKALWTAGNAKERIDLLKRSVFDIGEIVRTTSEQRQAAETNLKKVASETEKLLEGTRESVVFIERVRKSFNQMAVRMDDLTAAADRVVTRTSETMEFVQRQVEVFDELAETVAAFSEQIDDG